MRATGGHGARHRGALGPGWRYASTVRGERASRGAARGWQAANAHKRAQARAFDPPGPQAPQRIAAKTRWFAAAGPRGAVCERAQGTARAVLRGTRILPPDPRKTGQNRPVVPV